MEKTAINMNETFGANVRRLREEKGYSLRTFAKKLRMSATYLSKVERDDFRPPVEKKVRAIAKMLGVDGDTMLALAGRMAGHLTKNFASTPLRMVTIADFLREIGEMDTEEIQQFTRAARRKRLAKAGKR